MDKKFDHDEEHKNVVGNMDYGPLVEGTQFEVISNDGTAVIQRKDAMTDEERKWQADALDLFRRVRNRELTKEEQQSAASRLWPEAVK